MSRRRKTAGLVCAMAALLAVVTTVARAELSEHGDLFVQFSGGIAPNALPRENLAPISVSIGGRIKTLSGERPPALREITVELNRSGHLNTDGLPLCRYGQLVATTSRQALDVCGPALVGKGVYNAKTSFPEQATFPAHGHILAFNAISNGHEAILAHVFGKDPAPNTRIIVFHIRRSEGTYGTVLTGELSPTVNHYGYLESISLRLFRRYTYRGQPRSYLSAACAAPPGFFGASFAFARASMAFEDGRTLASTLTRRCAVTR